MTYHVRDGSPSDAAIIADFNSRLAAETEDGPLDVGIIGPGVSAALADRDKCRYWVAETDGRIVGQIMVTYEWSDWRNGMLWWIQSVYVHPDFRRAGVFSKLYQHVQSLARADAQVVGLRLYVEKDNERAKAIYNRLGMTMTNYQVMQTLFEKTPK